MSLTSLTFLCIYFPLLLIAYYNPIVRNSVFRKIILFAVSIGLYAICEPIYILLLIGVIIINYALVRIADLTNNDTFRAIAIILDACTLLFFKYINSILDWGLLNSSISSIAFPIGLSYFIFKTISYVADSKKEKTGDFLDVSIYISNFLTIVSGPLSTYNDELPSIKSRQDTTADTIYSGLERLVIGLSKKVIIADSLSILVKQCFSASEISIVMAWAGAIAYTFQLFFDFSGYTDMAIGIGKLFGFNLPENFNYPYMADSISDFWKRWHISLTKWFTKYIYIPLGGSRVKSVPRHIFNLFAVWFVTGIWHGSSITFVIWAMVYFVLQLLEKYTNIASIIKKLHLSHIYVLFVVIIEWVIFKAGSLSIAINYLSNMFGLSGNTIVSQEELGIISKYKIPLILGLAFSTDIGPKMKIRIQKSVLGYNFYNILLFLLFLVCITISISLGYSSPLYAGF